MYFGDFNGKFIEPLDHDCIEMVRLHFGDRYVCWQPHNIKQREEHP